MQERRFLELVSGDSLQENQKKGADMLKAMFLQQDDINAARLTQAIQEDDMELASKIVAENETKIPQEMIEEVRSYVGELERKGLNKDTIIQGVQDKFGIIVVPNYEK